MEIHIRRDMIVALEKRLFFLSPSRSHHPALRPNVQHPLDQMATTARSSTILHELGLILLVYLVHRRPAIPHDVRRDDDHELRPLQPPFYVISVRSRNNEVHRLQCVILS
jgi:hypothetical protein